MKKMYSLLMMSILVMSVTTSMCNHGSMLWGISFAVFEILCILLPGIALTLFLRIKNVTMMETMSFAYIGGYILSIVIYSLIMLFQTDKWLREIYGIITLFSAIIIFCSLKKKIFKNSVSETLIEVNNQEIIITFVTVFIIFIIKLLTFSVNEVPPKIFSQTQFNRDFLHWVSDVVSCKFAVPPINIRTLSDDYQYHYLGALQIALISKWMKIRAVDAVAVFSYLQPTIMLGLSSCCVIFRLIKNVNARIITLMLLFLTTGFENIAIVTYRFHIFIQPMTFDIGYAFFIASMLVIIIQLCQDNLNSGLLIFNLLLIGSVTGIKGPCGMLAVVAMGIVCLYWLFHKEFNKAIGYGATTLMSFSCIYILIMFKEAENYSATMVPGSFNAFRMIIGLFKYCFMINPITMTLAAGFVIYLLVKRKIMIQHGTFAIVLLIGIGMGYFIKMSGSSEMYFSLTVVCLASFLTGQMLDRMLNIIHNNAISIFLYGMCIVIIISSLPLDYAGLFRRYIHSGIEKVIYGKSDSDAITGTTINVVNSNEYLAYDWIRENTESDKIFLSERNLINSLDNNVLPALAERKIFYYKDDDIRRRAIEAYSGNEEMLIELIDAGIGYVIVHKTMSPNFSWPEEKGKLIFDNNEVMVYQTWSSGN